MEDKNINFQEWKSPEKNSFGKLMDICYIHALCIYAVCFGILIVSLNTTYSHFFMDTLRFHNIFGHGNLV